MPGYNGIGFLNLFESSELTKKGAKNFKAPPLSFGQVSAM